MGKHVKTLVDENQTAGFKTIKWDATNSTGNNVAAGMYIYQIKSGSYNETKKMILLKQENVENFIHKKHDLLSGILRIINPIVRQLLS